jgi:hypothetical protein
MSLDCRVFAIRQAERNELVSRPEWVLGRSLLAGDPICELRDAGRVIQVILAGTEDELGETATFLLSGGTELPVARHAGSPPRLLDVSDVDHLDTQLNQLHAAELQRRFHRQIWVTGILERISAVSAPWESHDFRVDGCTADEDDFAEEWTLDQADEYERIAQQLENLKAFVSQAVRQQQCLVIAIQETE